MALEQEAYNKLFSYTLTRKDPSFIHQHTVDVYTAQHADDHTKPIGLIFALVGLYLYLEKNYSGRQVQEAHMKMAKRRKNWPMLDLPKERGSLTIFDVLAESPGKPRDEMIRRWCESVWAAYGQSHETIERLVQTELYQNK